MLFRKWAGAVAAAVLGLVASGGAQAQFLGAGGPAAAGKWFAEGNVGAAWGDFDGFALSDGTLTGASSSSSSFAASAGLGFYFTNQIFARISYRYFGSFDTHGDVIGVPVNFNSDAHGLMLGLGFNLDLSRQVFLEATGEIGAAWINTSGSVLGLGSRTDTNLAGGVGLGLGYRLTSQTDLLVNGNFHWLGDANTSGATGISATANDLSVTTLTIGARVRF